MSSFYCKNRLKIANFASELKTTFDIHVETYIAENQHDQSQVDKVNKAREEWINEINECEAENLAELEKREDRDLELNEEILLKHFCFIVEYLGDVLETGCFTWRFISTDTYMSLEQIAIFQVMIQALDCDIVDYAQPPSTDFKRFEQLFDSPDSTISYVNK
jgi:hypothetical protein